MRNLGEWYDPTSWFSSDDVPKQPTASQVEAKASFDPNMSLSSNYKLRDLSQTNFALTSPNIPSEQYVIDNLSTLARYLDRLDMVVGPFQVVSGFRTKELQTKLGESGAPTAEKLSFHEVGRAVDLYPTTMTLDEFFGKILANSILLDGLAEISIKPSQNSIHLSVNVPGDYRTARVLALNPSTSVYEKLSTEAIADYVKPFVASIDEAVSAAGDIVKTGPSPVIIIAGVAVLGLAVYLMTRQSAHRASSGAR